MRGSSTVGAVFATAVMLTFGVVASAQASAGDDAHVLVSQINGIADPGYGAATIGCPFGERAISGGIRRNPVTPNQIFVSYSAPFASSQQGAPFTGLVPNQWRSRIHNLSGHTSNFYAFAVCSASTDAVLETVDVAETTSAEAGYEATGLAMCPSGQRAIGGGVYMDEFGDQANLEQSGPVDETGTAANTVDGDIPRGWLAELRGSVNGIPVRVFAVCSASSLATIQVESLAMTGVTSSPLPVVCPTGQRALSGGMLANVEPYVSLAADVPANSLGGPLSTETVANGWYVYINNYSVPNTYKAAVVCEGTTPGTTPTDPTNPNPNPTNPNPPSNDFKIGQLTRNTDKGTATLEVTVASAGTVAFNSPKLKPQSVDVAGPGDTALKVKASAPGRERLKRKGKLKAPAEITFTPTGGTPAAQSTKLKLIRD